MADSYNNELLIVFENELMPHIEALKTFAFHLTYDEELADDLVQETYLKAFKFLNKYRTGTNAKAWLFTILKNAYINLYRQKASRPTQIALDQMDYVKIGEEGADNYVDLRDEIFEMEMGDEITLAIMHIPEDFRTVILLSDVDDFTYEEISEILSIPIGTVRSRLFRGRNLLKEKLKQYAEKRGYKDIRGKKNKTNV